MTGERVCRCELSIPASILEGYACGRPDCWRTAAAQASFEGFVAELVRRREIESRGTPSLPEA